jgi:DNA-binding response OmpR family regulator
VFKSASTTIFEFLLTSSQTPINVKKRIVIFEDDIDIAELCSLILTREGFSVHHFLTVEDHISHLLSIKPHLVLMDYMIPGGGGDKATRDIKKTAALNNTKVVIISASTAIERVVAESGADGMIKKPFDLHEFIAAVNEFAGQAVS